MKTIVVSSPRGGSGKSTLSVHLAIAAQLRQEGPVVLLDADPLRFALSCCEIRQRRLLDTPSSQAVVAGELESVLQELKAKGTRCVIVDTPPSTVSITPESLRYGDLVLIPVDPNVWELHALKRSLPIIRAATKTFSFVWCRATKIVREEQASVLEELTTLGPVFHSTMRQRVIYTEPFIHGYSAFEDRRNGDPAANDVFAILAEIQQNLAGELGLRQPTASAG